MAGKPQLLYFKEFPGRGEIMRLLYHYAGAEFEDKKVPFADFLSTWKSNVDDVPLGFFPVLTTSCGDKISQTAAIIRYIAAELKLDGKTNVERALIDSTLVCNKEISDAAITILFAVKDESEKKAKLEGLTKLVDKYFPYFEKLIQSNGGDFINGTEITVADIYLLDVVGFVNQASPDNKHLEKYPLLKVVCDKVKETENLKKYLASR